MIAGIVVLSTLILFFTESASLLFTLAFVAAVVAGVAAASRIDSAAWRLVGLGFGLGAAVLFSLSTWAVSVPGSYFIQSLFAPLGWFLLGLGWVGWVIYLALRRRRAVNLREVARLLSAPLLAVMAFAVVETDAAFHVRYAASKGAMNTAAREVAAGSRSPEEIHRIGLWNVEKVERVRGGMRFLIEGTGFLDPVGFAYSPHGPPPSIGEDFYEHFEGSWWFWTESW